MSAIDPSTIDTTQPPAVDPTTSGVRGVFLAIKALFTTAKSEIETLDAGLTSAQADATQALSDAADAQTDADQGIADAATAQTLAEDHDARHLPSGADPLTTGAPPTLSTATAANAEGTGESFARSDHAHRFSLLDGTTGARPAAAAAGRLYRNTTTKQLERDTGAAWVGVAPRSDLLGLLTGDTVREER
ncbi:unnamed protein product, partial [marine sediment metagenome]